MTRSNFGTLFDGLNTIWDTSVIECGTQVEAELR